MTALVPDRRPLEIGQLTVGYGDLTVLRAVDLHVEAGEVVAVIGPNGAGKSTLLKAIAGVLTPTAGRVHVLGIDGRRSVHRLARRGLGFVPSERGLFAALTVGDNIRIRTRDRSAISRVVALFPRLEALVDRRVGLLSGGEQQMLAIGAVLVTHPRLLLLDEMSMGLAPTIVRSLLPVIRRAAQDDGIPVLIVEQHVPAAVDVADRILVLNRGRIVHEASASAIRDAPDELTAFYFDPHEETTR
jgi:branched-chain amino acid transport system ATP-binding protein